MNVTDMFRLVFEEGSQYMPKIGFELTVFPTLPPRSLCGMCVPACLANKGCFSHYEFYYYLYKLMLRDPRRKVKMKTPSELFDKPQQIPLMKTSEQFLKMAMLTASEDMMI